MGARLKRIRDQLGISQEELAARANVPVGTLRNYEQGRRLPRIDAAARLAKALSITLDVLAECVNDGPPLPEE